MTKTTVQGGSFDAVQGRPIRVCIISPLGHGLYHPASGQPFGGAEVQCYLLAMALSEDPAFQVSVLTTVNEGGGEEQLDRVRVVARVGKKRVGADGTGTLRGSVSAFAEMYHTLGAVDADVYLHAGAGVEVGAYALICRLLRRRFLFVVASSGDLVGRPPNVHGPLAWLYSLGLRLTHAIVCRTAEQQAALRMKIASEGILIRSGHALPPTGASPRPDKSTILWVGRMHPLKQPELFLDLAARLPKERFVMVAARDATQPALHARILDRAGNLSNVTVREDVLWSDVGEYFEQAKLFVNTSTYEGFPNTFVQSAMRGVPILSWQVDPDRVLAERRIGSCAEGSFERLVAATEELCDNEPLRMEVGRRAIAYARAYHDLTRTTAQFKELIRRVTRGR